MTEEEAKTKWCPMVRMHPCGYNASLHDDGTPDQRYGRCIGSDCMAWRSFSAYVNLVTNERVPATGHCGLAGKP